MHEDRNGGRDQLSPREARSSPRAAPPGGRRGLLRQHRHRRPRPRPAGMDRARVRAGGRSRRGSRQSRQLLGRRPPPRLDRIPRELTSCRGIDAWRVHPRCGGRTEGDGPRHPRREHVLARPADVDRLTGAPLRCVRGPTARSGSGCQRCHLPGRWSSLSPWLASF